jgi:uncharacterized membrane protein
LRCEGRILLEAPFSTNGSCGGCDVLLGCAQLRVRFTEKEDSMAFCAKCGTQMADGTAFCPNCGAPQAGAPAGGGAAAGTGMAENVAGLLCYVLGWITGLIFFLIDKRPFVRFHAAQSMVTFGALHVLSILLGLFLGASMFVGGAGGFGLGILVIWLINLACLVLWVLCMVKAYQGERFKLPLAGDIAENIAGK